MTLLRLAAWLFWVAAPLAAQAQSTDAAPPRVLRVGVLSAHEEPAANTSQGLYLAILRDAGHDAQAVSGNDIRNGALDGLDLFIIGGGSGTRFVRALGEDGSAAVEAFVRNGGGVLASCAGSYAFAQEYNETTTQLEVANARCLPTEDGRLWRGRGLVELDTGDDTTPTISMYYANGPVYKITDEPHLGRTVALATFNTDILREGDPGGVMPGKPAILAGTFGDGRFVLFSAHPEFRQQLGNRPLVVAAADWAARGPLPDNAPMTWQTVFGTTPIEAAPDQP